MTPQKWSVNALAVELGVDRRTIAKRLADVDPVAVSGRTSFYRMADAARVIFAPAGHGGGQLNLEAERARMVSAQANRTELEVEVLRGDLLSADLVAERWGAQISAFRARLVAAPAALAPQVVGAEMPAAQELIRDALYQALDELKDYDPSDYGGAPTARDREEGGAASGPAAGADGERVGGRQPRAEPGVKCRARTLAD